jgi:hypothetical protein
VRQAGADCERDVVAAMPFDVRAGENNGIGAKTAPRQRIHIQYPICHTVSPNDRKLLQSQVAAKWLSHH